MHSAGLEVTIGAFGGLVGGNTMLIEGATMRRERLGAWPLVSGNRDCIRLCGNDGGGPREWKVAPRVLRSTRCGRSSLPLASPRRPSVS